MYRGRSNITLGAHVATHYRDLEDSESDEDVDGIEYIGQIRGPREASSLVGNAAARGGAIRQENQQTEYGSLSVERGLYGGQTEEEDKTGPESRGQMVQGYAIGVGSGASTRAQGNRDTRTPPSPAGISPVQRSSPSPSSPSIAPLLARHDPSRLLIQSLDDPSPQTPTSSFPLVRHDPNPDQPNSPPASYAAAYNYYQVSGDRF
ncbi:hypothetical protein CALCODRAFT_108019 [Calocera cornea HHB12733]|uniref:Uncharacterized protein n=1 Tax=Calocera cornea HHB12733 TaxID=1353952 RepID=A0A165IGN1_9BASI|nr:hypothetical protein CALCODRAFT_108019 [Calocera cornea HHB12733]